MNVKRYVWGSLLVLVCGLGLLRASGVLLIQGINNKSYAYYMPPESKLGVHTKHTKLDFKTQPRPVQAGEPAIWLLKIINTKFKTRKPLGVKEFKVVHEKLMHLIVVSKDLKWFTHIHPDYKENGLFMIRPTLPRAGTYKLYADYTPLEGVQEVAQQELTVQDATTGATATAESQPSGALSQNVQLTVEKIAANGWYKKPIASLADEQPVDDAALATMKHEYEVSLKPIPKLASEEDMLLHFKVRDMQGREINDLQPYLGEMGHLVILSASSNIFLHTHPLDKIAVKQMLRKIQKSEPQVSNSDVFFHIRFPKAGVYKVWGQFKHRDRLLTAPIVVKVAQSNKATEPATTNSTRGAVYTCPMDPEVTSTDPKAPCPKCGMSLVKK